MASVFCEVKMCNSDSENEEENSDSVQSSDEEEEEEEEESTKKNILPEKSAPKYSAAYEAFTEWKRKEDVNQITEKVLLTYFNELAKTVKPTTLWTKYSMLRSTLQINDQIDISSYTDVQKLLKENSEGHKKKKAKIFTKNEVRKFLAEAPDNDFLAIKVVCIFGIHGALRSNELTKITLDDISYKGQLTKVVMPGAKNKSRRFFIITEEFHEYIEAYKKLRPKTATNPRFFLCYRNGQCTSQVIGKNTFSSMPSKIAEFLNLSNPKLYTGYAFRRTAATFLSDSGVSTRALRRLIGKSDFEDNNYVDDTTFNKIDTAKKIAKVIISPSTSNKRSGKETLPDETSGYKKLKYDETIQLGSAVIKMQNCTVHIHVEK